MSMGRQAAAGVGVPPPAAALYVGQWRGSVAWPRTRTEDKPRIDADRVAREHCGGAGGGVCGAGGGRGGRCGRAVQCAPVWAARTGGAGSGLIPFSVQGPRQRGGSRRRHWRRRGRCSGRGTLREPPLAAPRAGAGGAPAAAAAEAVAAGGASGSAAPAPPPAPLPAGAVLWLPLLLLRGRTPRRRLWGRRLMRLLRGRPAVQLHQRRRP